MIRWINQTIPITQDLIEFHSPMQDMSLGDELQRDIFQGLPGRGPDAVGPELLEPRVGDGLGLDPSIWCSISARSNI